MRIRLGMIKMIWIWIIFVGRLFDWVGCLFCFSLLPSLPFLLSVRPFLPSPFSLLPPLSASPYPEPHKSNNNTNTPPELIAITSLAVPDPANWAFSPANDYVFDNGLTLGSKGTVNHASPEEWIRRGGGCNERCYG